MIEVRLPLPPRDCSPNRESHGHWRARHKGRTQYRGAAHYILRSAMRKAGFKSARHVVISCEFFCAKVLPKDDFYRPRDVANAIGSLKSAIDGFVDAGLVPDDSAAYMSWGRCIVHGIKESQGRCEVVLTITGVDDAGSAD